MTLQQRADNERWLMSFYRLSEIAGAEFFARLARFLPAGQLQVNMTKHFADESNHAWFWTKAIDDMGFKAEKPKNSYQDAYLEAAGLPVNMMEVLAITHVFEKRAAKMYSTHLKLGDLAAPIESTIRDILVDEAWHVKWVADELKLMEGKFGKQNIQDTLAGYKRADQEVYQKTISEYEERIGFVVGKKSDLGEFEAS